MVPVTVGRQIAVLVKFPSVFHFGRLFIDAFQFLYDLFTGIVVLIQISLLLLDRVCVEGAVTCGVGLSLFYANELARSWIIGIFILNRRQIDVIALCPYLGKIQLMLITVNLCFDVLFFVAGSLL